MATILITGATGFIGSHLTEALSAQGHQVRCLIRSSSSLKWLPKDKLALVEADMITGQNLDKAVKNVDIVYHLAGATKAKNKHAYYLANVEATRQLLLACRQFAPDLKRFVFMSSQAAAGPTAGQTIKTEDDPCRPITHYGQSKLEAEKLLADFTDIPWVCLRAVSVYGPRDKDVLTLIQAINRGVSPVIGSIHKQLTFVHVADVVQALMLAGEKKQAVRQTYFITDGRIYTWIHIRSLMEKAVGKKAINLYLPLPLVWLVAAVTDLWSRLAGKAVILNLNRYKEFTENNWGCSSDKLQAHLNFIPQYDLEKGLPVTVDWARQAGWLK